MKASRLLVVLVSVSLGIGGISALPAQRVKRGSTPTGVAKSLLPAKRQILNDYVRLPLAFEPNLGQTDKAVKFLSRGNGFTLFLTSTEAVLSLRKPASVKPEDPKILSNEPGVVSMRLIGANPDSQVKGQAELSGRSNYFIGKDPQKWRTNVPHYERVQYQDVYPGIDLIYYGKERQLEYDFVLEPGANPASIQLNFEGAKSIELDDQGNLILDTDAGEVTQQAPVIYQEFEGARRTISGHYALKGDNLVGFEVGTYDPTKPLVIDPVLLYSTYLGGSGYETGTSIAAGSDGSAFVTGHTSSATFPGTAPGTYAGGGTDAFVARLNAAGDALLYSTFLGGSSNDAAYSIAVDSTGSAYVAGQTLSTNFPATTGAFQEVIGGWPLPSADAFVAKLNSAGSLVYATFLGGSAADYAAGIAIDSQGNAYVTGFTFSSNFPVAPRGNQTSLTGLSDAFVTKLNSSGSGLPYSRYLGGSFDDFGTAIAVDSYGRAYVTGSTESWNFLTVGAYDSTYTPLGGPYDPGSAFVAVVSSGGLVTAGTLLYSTFLGGSGVDQGNGIALDAANKIYVTGETSSSDFPVSASAFQTTFGGGSKDAFLVKLDRSLTSSAQLVFSSYLGGVNDDTGESIALQSSTGWVWVTGDTKSPNFPTAGAIQLRTSTVGLGPSGFPDAFVTMWNPMTPYMLSYSTRLGGGGSDRGHGIALDSSGNIYVTGITGSPDFSGVGSSSLQPALSPPIPPLVYSYDAFVTKLGYLSLPGPPLTP